MEYGYLMVHICLLEEFLQFIYEVVDLHFDLCSASRFEIHTNYNRVIDIVKVFQVLRFVLIYLSTSYYPIMF